jgi:hypothetical protein
MIAPALREQPRFAPMRANYSRLPTARSRGCSVSKASRERFRADQHRSGARLVDLLSRYYDVQKLTVYKRGTSMLTSTTCDGGQNVGDIALMARDPRLPVVHHVRPTDRPAAFVAESRRISSEGEGRR